MRLAIIVAPDPSLVSHELTRSSIVRQPWAMAGFVAAALLIVVAGVVYQLAGVRRDTLRYPAPGTIVEIENERLHVTCLGSGRPVVLFESGIAASSLSWTALVRQIAQFTRGCAYDRAGLGWSAASRVPRTDASMLAEMRGVLQHADDGASAVLVGHSFGALLVCAYASQHPSEVAGLVLLDPPSEWHETTVRQRRMLWGGIQLSRLGGLLARVGVVRGCLTLLTGGAPAVPRNFVRVFGPSVARELGHLVGEVQKLPPEIHPMVQALWCQPKCFRAMAHHLAALQQTATAVGRLTSLPDVPLVVISSTDHSDEIIARHCRLAALSPKGRHIIARRSGHWIQFDEPDLVVEVVRAIVEETRRTHAA